MTTNSFLIAGLLHEVFAENQVSEKFRKREFVLELEGQFPEHVKFQLVQDKCSLIDAYTVGQRMSVEFNLRGRAFSNAQGRAYFTNLEAWRLQPLAKAEPAKAAEQPAAVATGPQL